MKKLKENKGISLIVFTIILAVLVIIAMGVIVYLLNNPKTVGKHVQNPTNVASYNSSSEIKEEYTNNLTDAQNGKVAFLKLLEKNELQTEKHEGYYTYVDDFENKYNIKEIKNVTSEKGIMGVDNWASLFKVKITYIDNKDKTNTMDLAIILLPNHEVQNRGTYTNFTGTTSFVKGFADLNETSSSKEEKTSMTSEEKYKIFVQNLKEEISKYNDENGANVQDETIDINSNNVNIHAELKANGNLSLHFGDEKIDNQYGTDCLVKDVLFFNIVYAGNGGMKNLYFVNEDGTVGVAFLDESIYQKKERIKVSTKLEGLKNIVSIISGGNRDAMDAIFIDIDGNVLNRY